MPKLNGGDAARKILQHRQDQKILVLTDVESEQVVRDCLQAGVRGWVFKSDMVSTPRIGGGFAPICSLSTDFPSCMRSDQRTHAHAKNWMVIGQQYANGADTGLLG